MPTAAPAQQQYVKNSALRPVQRFSRAEENHGSGQSISPILNSGEKLVFVPQDLLCDPPFSGLDLITCRNLFIYLEHETVKDILFLLHSALRDGGLLFLGKSEAYPLEPCSVCRRASLPSS
ncbi:CheR family methyltransferase [Trinickia dabaoshanensis]|uniref:CheR family methyltransferase n=1 Tax=Trinickia dabaoshanensis TaxID=564714 RepID=UPI001E65AEF0|nr:CheR family methyltransferase [Trinickia dabaoshanensis]